MLPTFPPRWHLMTLQLAGDPLPVPPSAPGRVCRCSAAADQSEALFLVLFGMEQADGSVRRVHRSGALRAALLDGYGAVPKSPAAVV